MKNGITPQLLVVDDDPFLATTMASALRRDFPSGTVIRVAHSLTEAMQYASRERFHGAVVDFELPDGHGINLIKSMMLTPQGRATCFFLVSGRNPEELGIAKILKEFPQLVFIEKPFRYAEVVRRVYEAVIPRTAEESNFHGLKLFDLVQAYALARHDATVRILFSDGSMGLIALLGGEMVHACIGKTEGEPAVLQIADKAYSMHGEIRMETGCPTSKRTIHKPTQQVFLDVVRILDETRAGMGSSEKPHAALDDDLDLDALLDDAFKSETP